jgi:DNA repair protein RecO (recombination protein O)
VLWTDILDGSLSATGRIVKTFARIGTLLYNPGMPARERSTRVDAVVLRHTDWGEADRLLGLYTRELGKLRVVAKGVRKLRSRKAGHLEPFTRVSLLLAHGRDLQIVTQAETIHAYTVLKEDLLLLGYASYVVELLDRFTYEEGENRALYRLLTDTLTRLASRHEPFRVVRYYEMRLLDLIGFRPQLFHCAKCGQEILPEDQFFSGEYGGVLCPGCGVVVPEARPISTQALKYLRHYQRSIYEETARAQISLPVSREMEALMQYYLTYLLERGLNTPTFLHRVKNLEKAKPKNPDW